MTSRTFYNTSSYQADTFLRLNMRFFLLGYLWFFSVAVVCNRRSIV